MVDSPSHASLAEELRAGGFDVFAPMRVSWYNDYLRKLGLATDSTSYLEKTGETHASGENNPFKLVPMPDYGRQGNAMAFFVGNSKAMWPCFLQWLRDQPDPTSIENPVDTYAAETIGRAMKKFAGGTEHDVFWAADTTPERLVDMNRAAAVASVTYFSEELFLSVHPNFGSWVAFRAVAVFDAPASPPLDPEPRFLPTLLRGDEAERAKELFADAMRASSEADLSLDGMALEVAHKWAAMRDCVSLGREHKYSVRQSEYHYSKDPKILYTSLSEVHPTDIM
eukprot:CAMPEP_0194280472 /NCGR_PEP_ID=MMETSP0169-20130528/17465_1 /TAXON_ID=218684 /ORGANISM="Corethron pennatum, Strain L29A3" /LENGTH=281 /DNA_ID=CAMNT_0039025201 /DNA_START=37 /DNA_END=882 /DNA_ORIENTATION=-